jgi:hypothetical protein
MDIKADLPRIEYLYVRTPGPGQRFAPMPPAALSSNSRH